MIAGREVGQDVAAQDRDVRGAQRLGGGDELTLLEREHEPAHDARQVGPVAERDHQHDVLGARSGDRDQRDAEQQQREREHDVGEAHQHRVDDPAHVAGDRPDRDADQRGEAGGDDSDQQRDARAEDQARQDVPAVGVGAEQEPAVAGSDRGALCGEPVGVGVQRVVRCEQRGEDRHDGEQQHDHHRDERDRVGLQAAPGDPQEVRVRDGDRLGGDRFDHRRGHDRAAHSDAPWTALVSAGRAG